MPDKDAFTIAFRTVEPFNHQHTNDIACNMLVQRLLMSSVVRCLQQYIELVCRLRFLKACFELG